MEFRNFKTTFPAVVLMLIMLSASGCYYYDHDFPHRSDSRYRAAPTSPAQSWEHHFGD